MTNRILSYINISSAQAIVFVIFLGLVVRLQMVISRTESQLVHEKNRATYLNNYLDSLMSFSKNENEVKQSDQIQHRDTSSKKKIVHNSSSIIRKIDDTASNLSKLPILPKHEIIKKTFSFSGSYDTPIDVNKLFSIERIELALALTRYDSLYQYTEYLGLTNWKLKFNQRRKGRSADIISVFRIRNAQVENNQSIICDFVEDAMDFTFSKAARVVKFKGIISNSGITGDLSWIDRTDGRLVPMNISLTLIRKY
jgi:hypothetical protein